MYGSPYILIANINPFDCVLNVFLICVLLVGFAEFPFRGLCFKRGGVTAGVFSFCICPLGGAVLCFYLFQSRSRFTGVECYL